MPGPLRFLFVLLALLASAHGALANPPDLPERERATIEALIASVEQLRDAHFVRNGKPYSASDAATFLHKKWKSREADVHTAEEFIDRIGSFSSTTSKPYLIRYADGREESSAEFLRARLEAMRAK